LTTFRNIEAAAAISGADRRHDHITLAREPERGVSEFDERKKAALFRVERDAMVHDDKRKRTVAGGVNDVGEGRKFERQAPNLFLQLRWRRWFCLS